MSKAYYNEIDPFCVQWLKNLIAAGHIAKGEVDDRSVEDVLPSDLEGFTQCHFFAGLGGWSYALWLAGWPDDRPVWTGSCPCFPSGTLIFTQRGNIPIEEVLVNDRVLTHKARWRRVTATGRQDTSSLSCVKGQGHWGLQCTPNHRFLTENENWIPAASMKGERWRTVAYVPSASIPALPATRTKNKRGSSCATTNTLGFAYFLGYWVGDGWVSGNSVCVCAPLSESIFLLELMKNAGLACSISRERTTTRGRCGSKQLVKWLTDNFGSGASTKRLPAWLHGAPVDYRTAFLEGYAAADGHLEAGCRVWTTTSKALAIGTRMLLNQEKVSCSISIHYPKGNKSIEGRAVLEKPFYQIKAYKNARSFRFTDIHGLGYVRSSNLCGMAAVYNLSVEEDETYVADGIIVHNCQPFSAAGKGGGFADERHLWPAFHHLIRIHRPVICFGEQVASPDGLAWLDLVQADLEGEGYACGAVDICSAGVGVGDTPLGETKSERIAEVRSFLQNFSCFGGPAEVEEAMDFLSSLGYGAPHIRQRLYWVADALLSGRAKRRTESRGGQASGSSESGRLADPRLSGLEGRSGGRDGSSECPAGPSVLGSEEQPRPTHGFWRDADWLFCRDGKWRPAKSEIFPLAYGIPGRVGRLRAYGNAINPHQAAEFIRAYYG